MNKFTQPGKVKQITATIIAPENAGLRMIVNVVSQNGKFEGEVDKLLTKKWAKVREEYKGWFSSQQNFKLGSIAPTAVASDIWVVSLLVRDKEGVVNDDGLKTAVKRLGELARYEKGSVHVSTFLTKEMPALKELLTTHLAAEGTHVYFYDEPAKS